MKIKQLWQSSLTWILLLWCILSVIYHCPLWVVLAGVVAWVLVVFLWAPGVFWNHWSHFTLNQQKKERRLTKAVSYKPLVFQPYLSLATMYIRQKRWPEATSVLESAVELDHPRSGQNARILLAIAYRESANYDKAVEVLTNLVRRGVENYVVALNLATTLFKVGRLEEALKAAEKARSLDLKATQPVLLMGRIHFEQGEFDKARDDYQWSIQHLSWPVESYYWLGRAEYELGDIESAREHLKIAVTKIKDEPDMSDISASEAEAWEKKLG